MGESMGERLAKMHASSTWTALDVLRMYMGQLEEHVGKLAAACFTNSDSLAGRVKKGKYSKKIMHGYDFYSPGINGIKSDAILHFVEHQVELLCRELLPRFEFCRT